MEKPEHPPGPWYLPNQEIAINRFSEGFCETCRQFDFEWLLSNDLTLSRSNGERYATLEKSNLCLPLGTVTTILKTATKCLFCDLVIRSFRSAFAVEPLFHGAEDAVSDINSRVRSRQEHGRFGNFRIESDPEDPRTIVMVTQNRTPSLDEIDPTEAWLELDNRPITWAAFVIPGAPYDIRVWLCTAFNGRPVKNLVFHRMVSSPGELQGCLMSSQVDFQVLREWFSLSILQGLEHTNCLPEEIRKHFRLIDVLEERLVPMETPCRYAALSYVWGIDDGVDWLQNKTSNRKKLHKPGSISANDIQVQTTLRDAMTLVRNTGLRYLWIDRLCITQDDKPSRTPQLKHMDSIYKSAAFTIIAASESDATTGLPGITLQRPNCQCLASIRGISIGSRPPRSDITTLPWSHRGWTFQENLMSLRKLVFTANQVYLEDLTGYYEEDIFELPTEVINRLYLKALAFKGNGVGAMDFYQSMDRYCDIARDYTTRSLTKNCDILDAFAGISTALGGEFRCEFLFGLPTSRLNYYLLWTPKSSVERRLSNNPREITFPTWSWAGWEGSGVEYELLDSHYYDRIEFLGQGTADSTDYESKGRSRNKHLRIPFLSKSTRKGHFHQSHVLRLSVVSASFMLRAKRVRLRDFGAAKREYNRLRLYALEDDAEDFAGAVCIHDPSVDPEYTWDQLLGPFELITVTRSGNDDPNNPPPFDDSDMIAAALQPSSKPLERGIRKEHHAWLREMSGPFPNIRTEDPYFFTSPFSRKRFYESGKAWDIYNVLVVQRRGDSYYRIGIGRCFAEAFWRNEAVRKEISLS
ncbi:uncharacterized protein PAC_02598 [Phialocephala subalpina]|uniref:Heterokaryon incompatibility domain-containing protein n=1 Tax=Phialocephala subalpina TaxID=576137 RepID=A0A1L7WIX4_9HELO|nr:uncharacterized protein PAC_02598 [Phialocephala subalpina]